MKAVDAATMRNIDASSVRDYSMKSIQLMENAGRGVAEFVLKRFSSRPLRVSVIAGKGNNGGDGFVAARHLKNAGVEVAVYALQRTGRYRGDAGVAARTWQRMGGGTFYLAAQKDLKRQRSAIVHSHVIVDALLGTGLNSPVKGFYGDLIEFINGLDAPVISVDVPSGMDATTGQVLGVAVRADATVTMALPKTGFYVPPGSTLAGEVAVVDIGVPRGLLESEDIRWNVVEECRVKALIRPRERDSHKGTFGHVAVVSGSPGKTGAVYMAATAAMRAGAGLVTIGLPASLNPVMETKTTEVMTASLPETSERTLGVASLEAIKALLEGKDAVVFGPGMGTSPELARVMEKVLRLNLPSMVIDADGLNNLSGRLDAVRESGADIILTPHPGEAARLLGTSTEEVQSERFGAATELAERSGAVVVLKGANTLTTAPDGRVYINTTGNPGLATAGTGDVLSGVAAAFLATGMAALDAAVAAVYVHGLAADRISEAMGEAGMMATDLLPALPPVINALSGQGPL